MKNARVIRSLFQSSKVFRRSLNTNSTKSQSEAINSNLGNEDETTHFGFKTIKTSDKAKQGKINFINKYTITITQLFSFLFNLNLN